MRKNRSIFFAFHHSRWAGDPILFSKFIIKPYFCWGLGGIPSSSHKSKYPRFIFEVHNSMFKFKFHVSSSRFKFKFQFQVPHFKFNSQVGIPKFRMQVPSSSSKFQLSYSGFHVSYFKFQLPYPKFHDPCSMFRVIRLGTLSRLRIPSSRFQLLLRSTPQG